MDDINKEEGVEMFVDRYNCVDRVLAFPRQDPEFKTYNS